MIKKDYKAFAKIIKEERDDIEGVANGFTLTKASDELNGRIYELKEIERKIIEVLKADNPRFDTQKFLDYIEEA